MSGTSGRRGAARGWPDRADPRVKWLSTLSLIVVFVSGSSLVALAAGIGIVFVEALAVVGLSPAEVGRRLLMALPFALVTAATLVLSGEGNISRVMVFILRLMGAILAMALLTLSAERAALFTGAAGLGFPRTILTFADVTLRYAAVLSEEVRRLTRARLARGFEPAVIWRPEAAAAFASLVGALFVRSLDRAERVHLAMLARSVDCAPGRGRRPDRRPRGGAAAPGLGPAGRPARRLGFGARPGRGFWASLAWAVLAALPAALMLILERSLP
ncbi:MAG: hypothetical protein C4551_03345 [Bacillota bacterium]|nr:MAG: hypothetical protein C4551_03345 [Bacillota bacterium]